MKRILLPVDFSTYSDHAANVAAGIANKLNCELHVLHVQEGVHPSEQELAANAATDALLARNTERLRNFVRKHRLDSPKLKQSELYHSGSAWQGIMEYAATTKPDLVILGAYGSAGDEHGLIGSTTEKVMHLCEVPVLCVLQPYEPFDVSDVVLTSAFVGEIYDLFPTMRAIIDLFEAELHLLKVITPTRFLPTIESRTLITNFAHHFGLRDYSVNVFADNSIEEGVIHFAKSISAELIAIGTHGERRLNTLLKKSVEAELNKDYLSAILSVRMKSVPPVGPSPADLMPKQPAT